MIITGNDDLAAFCRSLETSPFIAIDTEFMREKTYYPILCLIQIAGPDGNAAAIDPLADSLDLAPVFDLLTSEKVVKVFHAARQDLEIFFNLTGKVPHPVFDTQVAAMVCGYGDQIGYTSLVQQVCGHRLDKDAQFTDWARRPLTKRQVEYALDDVIWLRELYRHLAEELQREGRESWVTEEMEFLTSPDTYRNDPVEAWRRIKIRSDKPKVLAVLKEMAAWREREAQRRDIPRGRVLKDETLAEIAFNAPQNPDDLARVRGMSADHARGKWGKEMIEAVQKGLSAPRDHAPAAPRRDRFPDDLVPVLEMLKMLLKIQCAAHGVAARLVAGTEELEALALDDRADIPTLHGWRLEMFGKKALALKQGKIGLALKNGKITVLDMT